MDVIICLILISLLIPIAYGGYLYAPWVPSKTSDLPRILKLANIKKGQIFYELGCGDGRVATYMAKNTDAKVIGIEIAYPLYFIAKLRAWLAKINAPKCTFKLKDLFKENIHEADVIFTYGMPKQLETKLKTKLEKEAKKGTRVLSYIFAIRGLTPIIKDVPSSKDVAIYVYEI